uniref:Transmembrane protein n=1 Tax=Bursaphelenchus xylophilus TaxID=6326 RepID=A0A1I7SWJ1_BURXY
MMTDSISGTTSSSSSTRRRKSVFRNEVHLSIWIRFSRVIFGKIRRLPKCMNTTLVLFTVHMYLTVPVIVAAGITGDLKALLRPFRIIYQMGFQFEELQEGFRQLVQ